MLGVNHYEPEYIQHCRDQITAQLDAYDALKAKAKGADAQITAFEPLFFSNLVHVLDNLFVHRLRKQEGKEAKEVRVMTNAALNGDTPPQLDEEGFRRLADAFFTEIEAKFAG
jgi:hypothetical protein